MVKKLRGKARCEGKRHMRTPKLCLHKSTGQAYIRINGRQVYLGEYGSAQALEAYGRLTAELAAHDGQPPIEPSDDMTIKEIAAAFLEYMESEYSGVYVERFAAAYVELLEIYGTLPAKDFFPNELMVVRKRMLQRKRKRPLSRTLINERIGMIKRMLDWAAVLRYIPETNVALCMRVKNLRKGKTTGCVESKKIQPVPLATIEAALPFMSPSVRACVIVQLHSAARAGELLTLRPCDIDRSDPEVWVAHLQDHKTAHHDKERYLYFGRKCQEALRPLLVKRRSGDYLFSPRDHFEERSEKCEGPGRRPNQKPDVRKTDRVVRDHYTIDTFRRAIERACESAGAERFTPHRIRHTAAMLTRAKFGIEGVMVFLGHSAPKVSEIYAPTNEALARQIAKETG